MRKSAFTLIELLIVIAIIGILAAVLIPNLLAARARAYDTAAIECLRQVALDEEVFFVDELLYQSSAAVADDVAPCVGVLISSFGTVTSYGYSGAHPQGSGTFEVVPGAAVVPQ